MLANVQFANSYYTIFASDFFFKEPKYYRYRYSSMEI